MISHTVWLDLFCEDGWVAHLVESYELSFRLSVGDRVDLGDFIEVAKTDEDAQYGLEVVAVTSLLDIDGGLIHVHLGPIYVEGKRPIWEKQLSGFSIPTYWTKKELPAQ